VTRWLFILLLLPLIVVAQDSKVLIVQQFAGLNTAAGDMIRKPNEAVICNNIDLSRNGIGTLSKRYGYDSVSYLAGMDECVGLDAIYLSDGRQYLGTVWDSTGVGYGGIYISPESKAYFTGTQSWEVVPNVLNAYTYIDTFIISTDTFVVSYTSDASATLEEIEYALYDTINSHATLSGYITAIYNIFGPTEGEPYDITEDLEFLSVSFTTDTAQTIDTLNTYKGKVWDYFSVQNKPWFAQFNDEWFVVNGAQKGVRWNGDVARSWPPNAPGEPSIIPLSSDGSLDGEYLYCFRFARTEVVDSLGSAGYVSAPIRVNDGQVMLKDFWWPATDSGRAETDTVFLVGYRTRANPGIITEGDYAFYFDTIYVGASADSLEAVIYIDSISDDGLSATDSVQLVHVDRIGRDSTGARDVRYGAPAFMDIPTWANQGVFTGIPAQFDTLGVAYRLTIIDTITNTESDGSAICYIWVDADSLSSGKKPDHIQLALPESPDTAYVRNLYRAHILQITFNNYFTTLDSLKTAHPGTDFRFNEWISTTGVDTVVTSEFRLIAQIPNDTNIVIDSMTYDSLYTRDIYRGATAPLMSGVFSYDNYLWGWHNSLLYYSDLDSAQAWGAFSRVAIDPDDGDQITVCFPTRAGIRILKNYSNYNVYDAYSKYEKVGDWGCIAPHSYAAAENGHFYLSARGVVFESEGMQLERTVVSGLVSQKLRNFDIMTLATKRDAVGRWLPDKGKYLLCIGDTTYVYDKRASDLLGEEVWSTWTGLTFTGGTLYNVEDNLAFLPGNDFYFVQDDDSRLFHYASSEYDPRTTTVGIYWQNRNMFADPPYKSQMTGVGIRGYSSTATDSLIVATINESNTVVGTALFIDSLSQRYRLKAFAPSTALEYGILLYNSGVIPSHYFSGYVDRIDVFIEPRIEPVLMR
jgi:hypothetical protein